MSTIEFYPKLLQTLKHYNKKTFLSDLMAGIIVGIVALPLAIAFGIASGASPETGITTAIVAGFLISLLGGSKVQIGGPTGAFIVIVYGIIQQYGQNGLIVATLLAGVLLILLGLFKLGTVIKYIPYPIIVGFTSGIAVTIFTTQVKDLFGLQPTQVPAGFIGKWGAYFGAFPTLNPWSLGIGLASILIIALTPRLSKRIPKSDVAVLLITFCLTVLFDLTVAIEVGLVIACLLFMRRVAETTDIHVITDEIDPSEDTDALLHEEHLAVPDGVEVYEINGPYFFGIANRFEEQMALMGDRPKVRIIRMRKVPFIDSTGLHNLTNLCLMSQKEGITIILSGVNKKVHATLEKSGFNSLIGQKNICSHINLALERARELLGMTKE